jgi:hypothetical protein
LAGRRAFRHRRAPSYTNVKLWDRHFVQFQAKRANSQLRIKAETTVSVGFFNFSGVEGETDQENRPLFRRPNSMCTANIYIRKVNCSVPNHPAHASGVRPTRLWSVRLAAISSPSGYDRDRCRTHGAAPLRVDPKFVDTVVCRWQSLTGETSHMPFLQRHEIFSEIQSCPNRRAAF